MNVHPTYNYVYANLRLNNYDFILCLPLPLVFITFIPEIKCHQIRAY